jgi:antitoxin ParD1/3/4
MDVSLTPELEQFIHNQVESGKYSSAADVILAGIQLLEERERIYQGRFEELRQEVLIGVEELDRGEVVDGEVVFQQLREKLRRRRAQAGQ